MVDTITYGNDLITQYLYENELETRYIRLIYPIEDSLNDYIERHLESHSDYYKGEFRESNESECEGLEAAAVWGAEHIIDRVKGEDKWHKRKVVKKS